jgi:photosystem II stability/assembly factor-like uncharacterized protein
MSFAREPVIAGSPCRLSANVSQLCLRLALALVLLLGSVGGASAHDPSAYGGLFRSRDLGGTWLNADVGLFLSAALTLAVHPRDPNQLLLGTDLGLMRSGNGGRSWSPEAPGLVFGGVFAIAFSPGGKSAICAAPSGVFRLEDGNWHRVRAPADAGPARVVAFGAAAERVYLLGNGGLFLSEDGGGSFRRGAETLSADTEMTTLVVVPRSAGDILLAIIGGRLMASDDGGERWSTRGAELGRAPVDTVAIDPAVPDRIWAATADRLHISDDLGVSWRAVGTPLPGPGTNIRGIAADPTATVLVVTTHRGMYRSEDGGETWALKEGNLPVHIEAGPLIRTPGEPRTLYAVFSLVPYPELWRIAVEGGNLLARTDPVSLAAGLAFVILLLILGGLLVGMLNRRRASAKVVVST